MKTTYIVYILTNASRTTLYTGVTGYVALRIFQHKHKSEHGFTVKYNVNRLVYYETYSHPADAIAREKQIKGWRRSKEIALIESMNPAWDDLAGEWERAFANLGPSTRVSPAGESAGAPPSLRMTPWKLNEDRQREMWGTHGLEATSNNRPADFIRRLETWATRLGESSWWEHRPSGR